MSDRRCCRLILMCSIGNTGASVGSSLNITDTLCSSALHVSLPSRAIAHISILNASTSLLDPILCHETCDVDLRNRNGDTPLHIAVRNRWTEHPGLRLHLGSSYRLVTTNVQLRISWKPEQTHRASSLLCTANTQYSKSLQ